MNGVASNIPERAKQTLEEVFGFTEFREGQSEVIATLLDGRSAAAVFPTGAGKSLCYQLPAILLDGVTLVISPLLALMKDQVDALTSKGVAAARLDSTLSADEYNGILRKAADGELKLLYVAPERFQNERFRESLKDLSISLFAVDEAHCVSEWGHNFRPDYLKLTKVAEDCKAERVLALTATATPKVLDDICRTFSIETRVRTPFHRPNLILSSQIVTTEKEKSNQLMEVLESQVKGATIVYVTFQKTAQTLADRLVVHGFNARPYHAGLPPELRAETQDWFLGSDDGIVVATIAFGMGIDKSSIRRVLHYDPPKSLESYSQEIGRAGRDGLDSLCQFFYYPPDRIPLENFVYGDTPMLGSLQSLLTELFEGEEELVLNLYQLSSRHDIRPLVLRTLLTYLELEGYLEERTPVYASYQFKALAPSDKILATLKGEQREFMTDVFRHAVRKRIWLTIDLEATSAALRCPRDKVVRALDWCEKGGWLEIRATDLRHRYRVRRAPESVDDLAEEMTLRAQRRETAEIERLNDALELATAPGCLPRRLAEHFGETLAADCGRCSFCRGEFEAGPEISDTTNWRIPNLPEELREPRIAARFLCGVTSPMLTKGRWTRHRDFGRLAHVSFRDVMRLLKEN